MLRALVMGAFAIMVVITPAIVMILWSMVVMVIMLLWVPAAVGIAFLWITIV